MTILLYILIGLVLLIFILAMIAPKTYDVFRTIEVARSKSEVYEYLKYLKNQDTWSPWTKKDPDMERKFTGTDGEVGAINIGMGIRM